MTIELRHIRYFLAVAQERHFTRAAQMLGIAQPPLSQQIKALEQEIGARLFHRIPQGAELTEAGRAFLAAVQPIPAQVENAVHNARRAARGETGSLRIGYTGSAKFHRAVPNAIRLFRRQWPEVALTLVEQNSIDLGLSLEQGALDIAFLRPRSVDGADVVLDTVVAEDMVMVLPVHHPLASAPDGPLPLDALRGEPLVLTTPDAGRTLFNAAVEACRGAGFEPVLGQPAPQIGSILALVAAEFGVSIVPASMRHLGLDGICYRTILGPSAKVPLALAHRRGAMSTVMRNFVTTARPEMRDDG
ncbi:LysR family transcriptional regulator [Sphingomonas sp. Leaf17]|uniref:LysR family transcriptional regulator n=1 Tax=Sphingomonas sp. Leaf17 TaxID=1735683 RepID=UPI000A6E4AEB|nr:LysR family transcriptional regulator [Sphingomonas sp. Leaf17]